MPWSSSQCHLMVPIWTFCVRVPPNPLWNRKWALGCPQSWQCHGRYMLNSCLSSCCCLLLTSSPLACLQLGSDHALLELELSRGSSDYAEPPSVLRKLVWIDGCSDCQAGCLIPNLDFWVLLFTGVAELARSLAICINRRSTSPAHSYSCCWSGYGYLVGYSIKGESYPLL